MTKIREKRETNTSIKDREMILKIDMINRKKPFGKDNDLIYLAPVKLDSLTTVSQSKRQEQTNKNPGRCLIAH